MKAQGNRLLIAFMFVIMFLVAMNDNVRGVFIPSFKQDFTASNTQMGIVLAMSSLGYITFTYIGGTLCEKIGHKKVMVMGFLFVALSLVGLYLSSSFIVLLIGLFFSNVGVALLAISINTLIPVIVTSFQALLMNMIHFCYGLGATVTQRTTGVLLFNGIEWRTIYLFIAILFGLVMIVFLGIKVPSFEMSKEDRKIDYKAIYSNKLLYFYMIALGLYVAAEMSTGNWFVNFMKEVYRYNESQGTYYTALFFGLFTLGRFFGGFIVEKIGATKSVLISSISAFVLYTIGFLLGQRGIAIIAASGFFFSITFPTLVLTISKVFKKNSAYITGIVVTVASTVSMIMNLLIGWLNDLIGVQSAYYAIPISLALSSVFVFLIYKNTKGVLE
ncbi:MFS transporter [Brassicibacter mesophilus]|uniref:MFS transporter n=1 Tax=Brassicibacter mesophilus TaxID=745119 RepID=UPI003D1AD6F4